MDWAPSAVRTAILEAHGVLRRKLDEMEMLLERVSRGESGADGLLTQKVLEFRTSFLDHLKHEEAALRPVLQAIDSWGPVRVQRMDAEHQEQRETLQALGALLSRRGSAANTGVVRDFLSAIRLDMDEEERESLREDLLKDDPITTGPSE